MSLILSTGEYLAIEEVNANSVTFRLHKDVEQRARYKAGTMDKYEVTSQQTCACEVLLSDIANSEKNILENVITAGYIALKLLPEFSEATDA